MTWWHVVRSCFLRQRSFHPWRPWAFLRFPNEARSAVLFSVSRSCTIKEPTVICPAVHVMSKTSNATNVFCLSRSISWEKRNVCSNLAPLDTVARTQRPRVRIPLKPRKTFLRAISQLLKLRFTAMVTYSFQSVFLWLQKKTLGQINRWRCLLTVYESERISAFTNEGIRKVPL